MTIDETNFSFGNEDTIPGAEGSTQVTGDAPKQVNGHRVDHPLIAGTREISKGTRVDSHDDETVPADSWIGSCRVFGDLGQSGIGRFYLAEQQKPVRRRVALKTIRQDWTPARSSLVSKLSGRFLRS